MTITQALKEALTVRVYIEPGNGLTFDVSKATVRRSGLLKAPAHIIDEGAQICGYDEHSGSTLWTYEIQERVLEIG
mgnify:CR=1 FL=1|tara:strand:- start:206 stop:433 length:228 start_codon:yes stop_codon:yes gene_type:complete